MAMPGGCHITNLWPQDFDDERSLKRMSHRIESFLQRQDISSLG